MPKQSFQINAEYIELNKLLKVMGWADSGGMANQLIDNGVVSVDGKAEQRKRCKLRPGQTVRLNGNSVEIVVATNDKKH